MKILVTGSSGLIGSSLVSHLEGAGHTVIRLTRNPSADGPMAVAWDPNEGRLESAALQGLNAAVHLAGEPILGRWTGAKKTAIRDSRVKGTRHLCRALAEFADPPNVLVAASAIGYYGDRGEKQLDEQSAPGDGFLADVCREWEEAATPAIQSEIRVVHARLGVVLSREGGALAKMLTPFRLGMGGTIGGGTHYMSWIRIHDAVRAITQTIADSRFAGPVNIVAPNPVTNREFTKTLGRVLRRPTPLPIPSILARIALGEVADEMLLSSTRVQPAKLLNCGFEFDFPALEPAPRSLLR